MTGNHHNAGVLRFEVLGPVRVRRDGIEVDLGPAQQHMVLALLLARAGQPVTLAEFVDLLWGEHPPPTAVNVVHRHVGAVRRVLEPALPPRSAGRVVGSAGEYRLRVAADELDLTRFRALVARGRDLAAQGRLADGLSLAVQALNMWRGPCADSRELLRSDYPAFTLVDRECAEVAREAAEAALYAGDVHPVLATVLAIADLFPLDEALQAQTLLLLEADGRRAEAVTRYERVRSYLADELGTDPDDELRRAYDGVLRRGSAAVPTGRLTVGIHAEDESAASGLRLAGLIRPAQLPADLPFFTGRDELIRQMMNMLRVHRDTRTAMPLLAIDGIPGSGKTTCVVHLAHQLVDLYPDGQLYIDLQGFHPRGKAVEPLDVLGCFLGSIGVPEKNLPHSLDARLGMARSYLAGRRVLIVLDNARDTEQVRPLLPGSADCLVLVTSRNRLDGLATAYGAHLVSMDVLSPGEARSFLLSCIGAVVTVGDDVTPNDIVEQSGQLPPILDEIAELCGRLPLALALVAGRALEHPDRGLTDIARELRAAQGTLDGFAAHTNETDLRAIFSWSYQLLSAPAAQLFRLLSLRAGREISLPAIASLVGLPMRQCRDLVGELVRTSLLSQRGPGRYGSHDLIRSYARELCHEFDAEPVRRAALRRLHQHYRLSAYRASGFVTPYARTFTIDRTDGVVVADLADATDAIRWLSTERKVLEVVIQRLVDAGETGPAWQLALAVWDFLETYGWWHDWTDTLSRCLAAADAAGDRLGGIQVRRGLAGALRALEDHDQAQRHLIDALELAVAANDVAEQAASHRDLGQVTAARGDSQAAIDHYGQSLRLSESLGDETYRGMILSHLAQAWAELGAHQRSAELVEQARLLLEECGDLVSLGRCQEILAASQLRQGDPRSALTHLANALELYRKSHSRVFVVDCLIRTGDVAVALGDHTTARDAWEEAGAVLRDTGLLRLGELRDRLSRLAQADA
ncbi:AfsR/SARP family transcriptional regulator [Micromonospora zingiberis]|uniref:AfsR/SARP family transcriptional regulator n=1 Tax=Micromonospora zingiberis TaxID=2053011 RepID=UPI0013F3D5A8|nr:BTAD domain-containing putative transcriptional regulator [Micromonospora zingiberis]